MLADCKSCAPIPADVRGVRGVRGNRGRASISWLALLPAALATLAPKCPLCVVAYLSAFGVTLGVASVALNVLRPLAIVLAALALAFALRRSHTRRSGRAREG